MKRILAILVAIFLIGMASIGLAADAKLSELTAATAVSADDLFLITDDPGGTPVSKKITAANLLTYFQAADADLTTYAGITPSANIQTLLGSADYATARTNLGTWGVSGSITDEQLMCAETTGGTNLLKSCGAKTTDNSTNDHILAKISGAVENATIVKTIYLPVAYFEDGAAPPAAAAVLASTRKVKIRDFDGASNENLEVSFTAPIDYSSGLKFRFIGYVSNATAPAENEVVAFSFAACSNGNSDALGCSAGTAQTSSLTAAAGYAQYDRLAGAWSNAITVTDIAAGETVQGILIRLAESTDTYAKDFALAGIEIKYVATFIMGSAY